MKLPKELEAIKNVYTKDFAPIRKAYAEDDFTAGCMAVIEGRLFHSLVLALEYYSIKAPSDIRYLAADVLKAINKELETN